MTKFRLLLRQKVRKKTLQNKTEKTDLDVPHEAAMNGSVNVAFISLILFGL